MIDIEKNCKLTDSTKKMLSPIGKIENLSVYKIPIAELKYNKKNGRIGTWFLQKNEEIDLDNLNNNDFNNLVEEAIKNSDLKSFNNTKNNIKAFTQLSPGVVLIDGTIIDGNRRFACLRELNKEDSDNDNFKYFEAVILNPESIDNKYLKKMEWYLQMGIEERTDYDPIEKLLDIYHNIVETKEFTINDYSEYANSPIKKTQNKISEAILLNDYLKRLNQQGNWVFAKDKKIEGSLFEIDRILAKIKNDDEKNNLKEILFDYLFISYDQDMSKFLRNIGQKFSKLEKSSKEKFFNNHLKINERLTNILNNNNNIDLNLNEALNDDHLIGEMKENVDFINWEDHKKATNNLPIKILSEFISKIDDVFYDEQIKHILENNKNEVLNLIDDIESRLIKIKSFNE